MEQVNSICLCHNSNLILIEFVFLQWKKYTHLQLGLSLAQLISNLLYALLQMTCFLWTSAIDIHYIIHLREIFFALMYMTTLIFNIAIENFFAHNEQLLYVTLSNSYEIVKYGTIYCSMAKEISHIHYCKLLLKCEVF